MLMITFNILPTSHRSPARRFYVIPTHFAHVDSSILRSFVGLVLHWQSTQLDGAHANVYLVHKSFGVSAY
jgi:hypothetical protein